MTNHPRLKKPIIFIGTGRSGSTVISEIISRHPDAAYVSNYNQKFPKNVNINVARLLFDNRFYRIFEQNRQFSKVSFINRYTFKPREAYRMWNYLTGTEIDFSREFLIDQQISEKRIDFIRSYFNSMVKLQDRERLVFKTTGPPRITFLSKIFPDAIFINLKRNYVPTIASFLKVGFWKTRGINQLWWKGVYNEKEKEWAMQNSEKGALITAIQLKKINEITELEVNKLKPKYLEVHYEHFVEKPQEEINRIIEFADLGSFDAKKHLLNFKIYNGNKKDSEYFNDSDLKEIRKILDSN